MRDQYAKPLEEKYKLVREALDVRVLGKESRAFENDMTLMNILNPLITYLRANPRFKQGVIKHIQQQAFDDFPPAPPLPKGTWSGRSDSLDGPSRLNPRNYPFDDDGPPAANLDI